MLHRFLVKPLGALAFTLVLAAQVQAGAWPRKQGTGFASASVELSWPKDVAKWTSTTPTKDYASLYLEYGLSDTVTLGLDVGRATSGAGQTLVFFQIPVRQKNDGPIISAQLGFGVINGQSVVRPGMMLGWGLENGWFSVDSMADISIETGETDLKLDVTWGRNLAKDRKLIIQVHSGLPHDGDAYFRIAPSIVMPLGKTTKMQAGATYGVSGDDAIGLKFGIWKEF